MHITYSDTGITYQVIGYKFFVVHIPCCTALVIVQLVVLDSFMSIQCIFTILLYYIWCLFDIWQFIF